MRVKGESPILHQTLDIMSKIPDYRERYGTEFTSEISPHVDAFNDVCDGLVERQRALDPRNILGIGAVKSAVLYEPTAFLASPLTLEQTVRINERETLAIAKYCTDVQTELAKVPILESGEGFVHLPTVFSQTEYPAGFSDIPFHMACGEWAGRQREFWVREGLADRLTIMNTLLGSVGVRLFIEDAFRPVGVQEGLFKRRVEWTKRDHPEWTEEQILSEAQSKTAIKPKLASHKGGAAIDARLQDVETGKILDFGHNYPDGGALVFPQSPFVTADQWRNRQLFQVAAGLSDLTLYVGEDWHVSYGDNLASLDEYGKVRSDYEAHYGPVKDFSRTTGGVTSLYTATEADKVFDY